MTRVRTIVIITLILLGILTAPTTSLFTHPAQAQQARDVPANQWDDRLSVSSTTKCAVNSDNSVWCWSDPPEKDDIHYVPTPLYSKVPEEIEGIEAKAVSASIDSVCIIALDNELWCWGTKNGTENDDKRTITAPKKIGMQAKKVQLINGKVQVIDTNDNLWEWGLEHTDQAMQYRKKIPSIKVKDIHTSGSTSCAVDLGNKVWCWGNNQDGILGSYEPEYSDSPILIHGITAQKVAVGRSACALDTAGEVFCWGDNYFGQLGSDTPGSTAIPTKVEKLPADVTDITTDDNTNCVLNASGNSWCWGKFRDDLGETTDINHPEIPRKSTLPSAQLLRIEDKACIADKAGYTWCTKDYHRLISPGDPHDFSMKKIENIRLTSSFSD